MKWELLEVGNRNAEAGKKEVGKLRRLEGLRFGEETFLLQITGA